MSGARDLQADVIVVGGGVIGLSVAHELAGRGLSVALVERGPVGGGASWASAGMLAPISESETDPPALTDLALDSLQRYPAFVAELERSAGRPCHLLREGTLWVALHADHEAELAHLQQTLVGRGLVAEALGAAELKRLEPGLSPRAVGGLRVAGDWQVDPRALSLALAAAIRARDGKVLEGWCVDLIQTRSSRVVGVSGHSADGSPLSIEASRVVLAAGCWSERGIAVPAPRLGLRPVKGQLVRLRGPRRLVSHVLRTPDVYIVPRVDGELLVGATMEERGFDETPTAGAALDLLRRGFEVLPEMYELSFVEVSVGLRSAVDDQLPVIGPAEGLDGLYLAFGHCRNGVLLAPGTAWHLAEWIVSGEPPPQLARFAPRCRGEAATRVRGGSVRDGN